MCLAPEARALSTRRSCKRKQFRSGHQLENQLKSGGADLLPVTVRNRSVTLGNSRGDPVTEPSSKRGNDWVVALFVVVLGVLLTPAVQLWAAPGMHWLMPYAVWGVLILLAYALHLRGSDGD